MSEDLKVLLYTVQTWYITQYGIVYPPRILYLKKVINKTKTKLLKKYIKLISIGKYDVKM